MLAKQNKHAAVEELLDMYSKVIQKGYIDTLYAKA